ncbi:MAG: hypothetical protein JEZ07_09225 [Phycisphaerae bacterium]|nr:hypothetical protein [Phycisphaerae bacterium]
MVHRNNNRQDDNVKASISKKNIKEIYRNWKQLFVWPNIVALTLLTGVGIWIIFDINTVKAQDPNDAEQTNVKVEAAEVTEDDIEVSADDTVIIPAGKKKPEEVSDYEYMALFMELEGLKKSKPGSDELKAFEDYFDKVTDVIQQKLDKDAVKNRSSATKKPPVSSIKKPATTVKPVAKPVEKVEKPKTDKKETKTPKPEAVKTKNPTKTTAVNVAADEKPQDAQPDTSGDVSLEIKEGFVIIKTESDIVDLAKLLETIGKELKLNYIYSDGQIPKGRVKLVQYEPISREELLPLMQHVLAVEGYVMVEDPPFTRIVKRGDALKLDGHELNGETNREDMVVTRLVTINNARVSEVENVLKTFVIDATTVRSLPQTNILMITEYQRNIPRLMNIIKMIDQDEANRKLKTYQPKYLFVEEAQGTLEQLMRELNQAKLTGSIPNMSIAAPSVRDRSPSANTQPQLSPTINRPGPSRDELSVFLYADARTNRLIAIGTKAELEQLEYLIELMDIEEPASVLNIRSMTIENLEVEDALEKIQSLFEALSNAQSASSSGAPSPASSNPRAPVRIISSKSKDTGGRTPFMLADERLNRILVVGSDQQIAQVEDLLGLVDLAMPDAEIRVEPIGFDHIRVENAIEKLEEMLKALDGQEPVGSSSSSSRLRTSNIPRPGTPTSSSNNNSSSSGFIKTGEDGPYLVADERTNRLLVIGNAQQVAEVNKLIAILDVDINLKLQVLTIQYIPCTDIAPQLADLIKALEEKDSAGGTGSSGSSRTASRYGSTGSSYSRSGTSSRYGNSRSNTPPAEITKIEPDGPYLLPDQRTNRLLVVGTDKQYEMVKELLPVLDVPPTGYDSMKLEKFELKYVDAEEAYQVLKDLGVVEVDSENQNPRERARNSNFSDTREFIVVGPNGTTQSNIGENALGSPMLPGMEEPEIRVALQHSTNRIFVYAAEYQLIDIRTIINEIDVNPEGAMGKVVIHFLENREPDAVATMLQEVMDSKRLDDSAGGDTKQYYPGAEFAPKIVALTDIYGVAVSASQKQHDEITDIIEQLDKRLPQVLIEATLVQVSEDDALNLGIDSKGVWNSSQDYISGNSSVLAAELSGGSDSGVITPITAGSGATIAFFNDDIIHAVLNTFRNQNNGKIESTPRVLVNDNEEGMIKSTRSEPKTKITIQPGSDTPIETSDGYEDAGTELTITPHISEGDFLKLTINLQVNSFDGKATGAIPPPKNNNSISTTVTVPDQRTIVLGGLTTQSDGMRVKKVPILGDIPGIGALFRSTSKTKVRSVLYIFVKASIVRMPEDKDDGKPNFDDIENLTKDHQQKLKDFEDNRQQLEFIPTWPKKKSPARKEDDEQ